MFRCTSNTEKEVKDQISEASRQKKENNQLLAKFLYEKALNSIENGEINGDLSLHSGLKAKVREEIVDLAIDLKQFDDALEVLSEMMQCLCPSSKKFKSLQRKEIEVMNIMEQKTSLQTCRDKKLDSVHSNLKNLALVKKHLNNYEEAERFLQRSLRTVLMRYGSDNIHVFELKKMICELKLLEDKYDDADQLYSSLLDELKRSSCDDPTVGLKISNIAHDIEESMRVIAEHRMRTSFSSLEGRISTLEATY